MDAVGLYARFISLDADEPLGLPSTIRNQIESMYQWLYSSCQYVFESYSIEFQLIVTLLHNNFMLERARYFLAKVVAIGVKTCVQLNA